MTDKNSDIVVTEVDVNDNIYVLANIYNPEIKSEQLLTLSRLSIFWGTFP